MNSFEEQLSFEELREDVWEGRAVRVFRLGFKAPAPKARPAWVIRELEGELWLDEATSVRLKVDLRLRAQGKKEGLELVYTQQVTGIGSPASIQDPSLEEGAHEDEPAMPKEAPPPRPAQPPRQGL